MDCVLIQHGKAHEIWRRTRKTELQDRYTQEILDAIVETADDAVQPGHLWDGTTFSAPPAPLQEDQAATLAGMKALQALARATFELKTTNWTLAEFRDRILTLSRS